MATANCFMPAPLIQFNSSSCYKKEYFYLLCFALPTIYHDLGSYSQFVQCNHNFNIAVTITATIATAVAATITTITIVIDIAIIAFITVTILKAIIITATKYIVGVAKMSSFQQT